MVTSCTSVLTSDDLLSYRLRDIDLTFVHAQKDLIVLSDGEVYYIFGDNVEALKGIDLSDKDICTLDEKVAESLKDNRVCWSFWVYAYLKKEKLKVDADIQVLDESYFDIVREHYEHTSDKALQTIFDNKEIFGLFYNGELAGFIGLHDDGTIGLLRVFKNFQGRGYGYILESYLINYEIDKGHIPLCEVEVSNTISQHIQEKLGLVRSSDKIYWLFNG